jgi:hypothetical protein
MALVLTRYSYQMQIIHIAHLLRELMLVDIIYHLVEGPALEKLQKN